MARLLDRAAFAAMNSLENQPALEMIPPEAKDQLIHGILDQVEKKVISWLDTYKKVVIFRRKVLWFKIEITVGDISGIIRHLLEDAIPGKLETSD